jgi:hypothetical protein
MGWWPIDPDTGKSVEGASSGLSRPPDFTLLNAVPGIDDDDAAHYLGDGPWDMVASYVGKIEKLIGDRKRPSEQEAQRLFADRILPPALATLPAESRQRLLRLVEELWGDIDGCYEDDWERPARPAEKKWICRHAVHRLARIGPWQGS